MRQVELVAESNDEEAFSLSFMCDFAEPDDQEVALGMEQGPFGVPLSFAPCRYPATHVRAGPGAEHAPETHTTETKFGPPVCEFTRIV